MELGFETVGNASIIAHDGKPVLCTDPWLDGDAYFGSWVLSHRIPDEQLQSITQCDFLWISHGHPDHLSVPSLEKHRDKTILLANHFGGRIAHDLRELGFRVVVMPNGQWLQLSDRLRVATIADYNQDSLLLIDLDGNLIVDANDASDRGVGDFLRQQAKRAKHTFLAFLTGYGDADMINFYDADGSFIEPGAAGKQPLGPGIAGLLDAYGGDTFLPSSSMHAYQRADSVWANKYTTPIEDHHRGFEHPTKRMLPAFVSYDVLRHEYRQLEPARNEVTVHQPEAFGDNWSDQLEPADVAKLKAYFQPVAHLCSYIGFVQLRVGGIETTIDMGSEHPDRGITFEVPRGSLMQAVEYQAFDDLLIGNYMKTTLHGDWDGKRGAEALYPHFTPFLTKVSDNGGARSEAEVTAYFRSYQAGGFFGHPPGKPGEDMAAALERYGI